MQSSDSTSDDASGGDEQSGRRTRRTVLATTAGTAAAALAGCLSGGDGDTGDEELDGWLGGFEEYDGPVDRTGESEVAVAVGAGSDGLAFDPLAVTVDVGTTVVWEWTGRGGRHNVVDRDGAFASEYYDDEGATFEYTFEETGTFAYYCEPHQALGMKGGVRVR